MKRKENIKQSTRIIKMCVTDLDKLLRDIKKPDTEIFISSRQILRLIKREAHSIYRTQVRGTNKEKRMNYTWDYEPYRSFAIK